MTNKIYDTAPEIDTDADLPVTLAQAKAQLRVTFSDDDAEIERMLNAAIGTVENFTNTKIRLTTLNIIADLYCELELPYGPHIDVSSVTLQNGNGAYDDQVLNTDFFLDIIGTPAATGSNTFARFRPYRSGRTKIVCTAGYGALLPDDLRAAILNELTFRYANRGDGIQPVVGICEAARRLAMPYRRLQWI